MTAALVTLEQLRACIGRDVVFEGEHYRIVDVLTEHAPLLVLSNDTGAAVIQPNQHGEATRRVPATRSVPVFSAVSGQLHPAFLKLNLGL